MSRKTKPCSARPCTSRESIRQRTSQGDVVNAISRSKLKNILERKGSVNVASITLDRKKASKNVFLISKRPPLSGKTKMVFKNED